MTEIEKYAKEWVNQAKEPPCSLDDDSKRWDKWHKESLEKWGIFLKKLPTHLKKKHRVDEYFEDKICYTWIPIPELNKQIEIEFKIKNLEEKGYVVIKKENK